MCLCSPHDAEISQLGAFVEITNKLLIYMLTHSQQQCHALDECMYEPLQVVHWQGKGLAHITLPAHAIHV